MTTLAVPRTGPELLSWCESIRPRGIAVGWCLYEWCKEEESLGFPGVMTDWDAGMVREAHAIAVLWLADVRLKEAA
jgi:hypothetical protein